MLSTLGLALSLLLALIAAAPPPNRRTLVNLRIEGVNRTIFEGPILTRGHDVKTVSGGRHHCDGTNNGSNPLPGPTCTSALDDAAREDHFTWDGYVMLFAVLVFARSSFVSSTFDSEFEDFFITSIARNTQTNTAFWGLLLNFAFTPVGGCQQEVKMGDEVLWAFDAFSKAHFLKLEGPHIARVHHPVTLTVLDGTTGVPVSGAEVNGFVSDAEGHVSVVFHNAGVQGVKAEKDDSIRSNLLRLVVSPF